jgi:hypothetical protein
MRGTELTQLAAVPDIVGVRLGPHTVQRQPIPRTRRRPDERQFNRMDVDRAQAPNRTRGPVAEEGTGAETQQGSEEVGLVAHARVADRKDVLVVPMEPLVPDHATDLVVSESKVPQLRARHHPVLACGKPGQSPLMRLTNVCSARRFVDH